MQSPSKLTKNQQLVFDALKKSAEPKGAYDLLRILNNEGLRAPLQVYRALNCLIDYGLVHHVAAKSAYVACQLQANQHENASVMAICKVCQQVHEFADRRMDIDLHSIANTLGFQRDSHPSATKIEMLGTCYRCQSDAGSQEDSLQDRHPLSK